MNKDSKPSATSPQGDLTMRVIAMPADANAAGDVFGGWVMAQMDLAAGIRDGIFREDLYYRLSVFPILIPPLRERFEDIPHFVSWFADKYSKGSGKNFNKFFTIASQGIIIFMVF